MKRTRTKAISRKNSPKKEDSQRNKRPRMKWTVPSRLSLLLEICKVKNARLSEEQWKEVAKRMGASWNGIREEYGRLMGERFPDWKRKFKPDAPSSSLPSTTETPAVQAQGNATSQHDESEERDPEIGTLNSDEEENVAEVDEENVDATEQT
ncbi:uncharacterized protein BP01DRAFT_396617 [Aspergillus saccharolyticus JOP 1030-1]|uniref:Myb-like domain-containing protein n=1 Tax=Aspergillus saccharolyticus JOP 1030-1 TaxID=1450539 RepID=A0A318ZQZ3_9EURO|nr:hypothetical protein BP01DRAFT_396617 [Aspergillus saccharolyticus JOP 1030-1]PYH49936.1 hypothetical protein BP01DRAFT_396617 [Aspergillus saccharolyticus JOP 1030-1]